MASSVIRELRAYLVAQAVVRLPRTAGALPACYLEPRDGVPAPGEAPPRGGSVEASDPVVGVFPNGGVPTVPFEGFIQRHLVDFRIRASKPPLAHALALQIAQKLDDRRYWTAGALIVHESLMTRPLGLIASDAQGYDYITGYEVMVRVVELAAL